ncbi:hypothetical protein LTS18_008703 [Coniosporium uncinatum]|uniref:Uncharacterized protein n=1 Tax=Coniosporium uncinatum TaxID=93489 RepID=A0ACC3DAF7_9PEZI|nr:hypothetical protein LTS18_008703 [Coniosporium uncinatum]
MLFPYGNLSNGGEKDDAPVKRKRRHGEESERDRFHEGQGGLLRDERKQTPRVGIGERLTQFTWAWFTLTMSTGGFSLLLSVTPHQFSGIRVIGKILFILNLVFFIIIVSGLTARFLTHPTSLRASLTHPTESLFHPCFYLTLATIILCTQAYGVPACGPWLLVTLYVLFWLYATLTLVVAVVQYWLLFYNEHLTLPSMTPSWLLPIFPAMLLGTLASFLAPSLPAERRMTMLVAGLVYQGLGWTVASFMYPLYLGRLMQEGFPAVGMRPGMFIAVGPPGYTSLALIGMANAVPQGYGYFAAHPTAVETLRVVALVFAIFVWGVGFWFFCISLVSCLRGVPEMSFTLTWWAFVFPNVGFTSATTSIGRQLGSEGVLWMASAMTVLIAVMWLFVAGAHIRAIVLKKVLYPLDKKQ